MTDPDLEREVAAEWTGLETLVQSSGLLTDEVRRLFQAMRRHVSLYRKPGMATLNATVPKGAFEELVREAGAVSLPLRFRIVQLTGGSALGNLLSHLHNRSFLKVDVEDTRALFGLDARPTAEFQQAVGMVTDALCSLGKTMELLRTCYNQAPARIRTVSASDELAQACA